MSVAFVRLSEGRLWHVAVDEGITSACGRHIAYGKDDRLPETLVDHVPDGGWVCDRCVVELGERFATARLMLSRDPRRIPTPGDLVGASPEELQEAVDAELRGTP